MSRSHPYRLAQWQHHRKVIAKMDNENTMAQKNSSLSAATCSIFFPLPRSRQGSTPALSTSMKHRQKGIIQADRQPTVSRELPTDGPHNKADFMIIHIHGNRKLNLHK